LTEVLENDWIAVHRFTAQAGAEQHALKLAAVGIGCRLVAREDQRQSRSSPPMRALVEGFDGALAYCAVLLSLHWTCRRQLSSQDWWSAGAAQAGLIVDGEWWRTFTALGLHADLDRLASNLVVGSLLASSSNSLVPAWRGWPSSSVVPWATRSTRYSIHGTHGDRRLNRRLRGTGRTLRPAKRAGSSACALRAARPGLPGSRGR
jgi:hypothetical protein